MRLRADGLNMENKLPWIYMNDIESVWKEYVEKRQNDESAGGIDK